MKGDKRVDSMNPAFVILYVRACEIIARSCGTWKFETIIIIDKEEKVLSLIANMTLTRKKILSVFLSAVLLITMLPVQAASAADPEPADAEDGVYFEWVGEWSKTDSKVLTSTKLAYSADAKEDNITITANNTGWVDLKNLDLTGLTTPKVYLEYTRSGNEQISICTGSWSTLLEKKEEGSDPYIAELETSLTALIFTMQGTNAILKRIVIYDADVAADPTPLPEGGSDPSADKVCFEWVGRWAKNDSANNSQTSFTTR